MCLESIGIDYKPPFQKGWAENSWAEANWSPSPPRCHILSPLWHDQAAPSTLEITVSSVHTKTKTESKQQRKQTNSLPVSVHLPCLMPRMAESTLTVAVCRRAEIMASRLHQDWYLASQEGPQSLRHLEMPGITVALWPQNSSSYMTSIFPNDCIII